MLQVILQFVLATSAAPFPKASPRKADLDVILYGATGCVGHLAAQWFAKQPSLRWAIAGRNESHLKALATELATAGGLSAHPELIVGSLGDRTNMSWVARARVVATAAGPFSTHGGEFLMRECIANGVHYVDTSDEFYWQREMIDMYDAPAREAGSKVVLAGGFCVLAGDLGAEIALGEAGPTADGRPVQLDAWLETYNGGISAGVIHTPHNASYPKAWDTDPYVLAPYVNSTERVDSSVAGMKYPELEHGEGLIVANLFGA